MPWPHHKAMVVADQILARLTAGAERTSVSGELRRRRREVGKVILVVKPRLVLDLFGEPMGHDETTPILDAMRDEGWLTWRSPSAAAGRNGPLLALSHVPSSMPVDIVLVRPPDHWGVALALTTGGSETRRALMAAAGPRLRGHHLDRLRDGDDEREVFAALGVTWESPERRD
jgi:DNA polymerase/3'-5' exonuclease PolX